MHAPTSPAPTLLFFLIFLFEPIQIVNLPIDGVNTGRWSNRNLLLTASLDWTARLWHLSRDTCISKILHNDIVTSIDFHPLRSEFCMTGSFDRKLRLWHVCKFGGRALSTASGTLSLGVLKQVLRA